MDEDTSELVDLLRRRADLLAYVREEPREKRAIVDGLGVPRSTLDRAIRELETAGLVSYEDGAYALTPAGEWLLAEFDRFVERAARTAELEPVLRWTDPEALDVDLRYLADADLWTPEPGDPWAMVNRHVRVLESADRIRGMLPLVGLHAVEAVRDRVVDDGADVRLVVDPGVAERFRTDENYAPLVRDIQAGDRNTLAVFEGEIPFFLGVFDDEFVQVGVDEDSEPRALLESRRQEVLAWAEDTLSTYRREAIPLSIDAAD